MTPELPIEWPEQPNPPSRPALRDVIVKRRAAEECSNNLKNQWAPWDDLADHENVVTELMDMFDKAIFQDGYEMARWLEGHAGWAPDATLVDILDAGWLHDARGVCVVDWVRINGIRPKHKVGDLVLTPKGNGTVLEVIEHHAEYTVKINGKRMLFAYEAVHSVDAD